MTDRDYFIGESPWNSQAHHFIGDLTWQFSKSRVAEYHQNEVCDSKSDMFDSQSRTHMETCSSTISKSLPPARNINKVRTTLTITPPQVGQPVSAGHTDLVDWTWSTSWTWLTLHSVQWSLSHTHIVGVKYLRPGEEKLTSPLPSTRVKKKVEVTNRRTRAKSQQIVGRSLLSCLQYPVHFKSSARD